VQFVSYICETKVLQLVENQLRINTYTSFTHDELNQHIKSHKQNRFQTQNQKKWIHLITFINFLIVQMYLKGLSLLIKPFLISCKMISRFINIHVYTGKNSNPLQYSFGGMYKCSKRNGLLSLPIARESFHVRIGWQSMLDERCNTFRICTGRIVITWPKLFFLPGKLICNNWWKR